LLILTENGQKMFFFGEIAHLILLLLGTVLIMNESTFYLKTVNK